jgi:hypothetical protein
MATLNTYQSPSVTASGETFAQWQAGGLSDHLERSITAQVATVAPTVAATATATGGGASGGLLAASTYYFVITEINGFGETLAGPVSTVLTVGAANIPRITFQALKSGNTARNIYITAAGGVNTGPWFFYAGGITASTFDLTIAVTTDSSSLMQPPTSNTTGLTRKKLELLRSLKNGNADQLMKFARGVITNFNQGEPISTQEAMTKLRDAHGVFAMMSTIFAEAGVLLAQNPGTIGSAVLANGERKIVRTWP